MSEIKQLHCDRCGRDMTIDGRSRMMSEAGRLWAHCIANLDDYDFCPLCWKEIMEFANIKGAEDGTGE